MLLGDIEESDAERQARTETSVGETSTVSSPPPKKPSARAPLPDHLPLETIVHDAPCVCPTCGATKFGRIGADERTVLEYVPSHFKRVLHMRPKMSCRACETVVQAPMPTLPIEKGRPSPALLAHVLVSKYCDHLPLHRQSDIYARTGWRSTALSWRAGLVTWRRSCVRRQMKWDDLLASGREALDHPWFEITRHAVGAASGGLRWSGV